MENEKATANLYLDLKVKEALEAKAKDKDRSLSWVANEILERALCPATKDKE